MSALSVIIVGAPRSGTYWVVDLLQTRLGIAIPTETHFYPLFQRYLWLWGDLSIATNRRRLLLNIYEFIAAWTVRADDSTAYLAGVWQHSLLVTMNAECMDRIVEQSHDYPSLVEAMYCQFAKLCGSEYAGDKSAHHRAIAPAALFDAFPETKMLHVIRDGRDVASSWLREWFGPADMADAASKWTEHIRVNREWGRCNPERYLEVRYEDLAVNLDGELSRLEDFFGRSLAPQSSSGSALAEVLAKTSSHARMKNVVPQDNVAKWRTDMSARNLQIFESIGGSTLLACGYELAETERVNDASQKVRAFSSHTLRVAAKSLLPVVLGVCTRLRIPVLPWLNRRYPRRWRELDVRRAGPDHR